MVEKVSLISSPQKLRVQEHKTEQSKQTNPDNNNQRKIDWKTIGYAGAAAAATIIGGIWYHRSCKNSDQLLKPLEELSEQICKKTTADDLIPDLISKKPFEINLDKLTFKYIDCGITTNTNEPVNIAIKHYPKIEEVEFDKIIKNSGDIKIYKNNDNSEKLIDGEDFSCHLYSIKNISDIDENSKKALKVIECETSTGEVFHILNDGEFTNFKIGKHDELKTFIEIDSKTDELLSITQDEELLDLQFAKELLKDFNINTYLTDKTYRINMNKRFSDSINMLDFAKVHDLIFDDVMDVKNSKQFKALIKHGKEHADYIESPACKKVFRTLENTFGIQVPEYQINDNKIYSDSDLFKLLRFSSTRYTVNANTPIKYNYQGDNIIDRYGIVFNKETIKLDDLDIDTIQHSNKIETDINAAYIRFTDDLNYDYKIFNPEKITAETPKITSAKSNTTSISLAEYPDKKVYELQPESFNKPIKITINKDGSIDFNESYIKDENLNLTTKLQPEKEELIKELIEIVDFSKISSDDWQQTFKGMANEVL